MINITRFEFATGFWKRIKGLLDPTVCETGKILVLIPCKSIHSFGMREAIDVAFLDDRGRVLKATRGMTPQRFLSCRGAVCVFERRSGTEEAWFEPGESVWLMAQPKEDEI
jgi:uncharacterized membrane protein (UPF0127 family)